MKIVISSGHGKYVRGASGYLDEVDEARRVVNRTADILKQLGVSVVPFHDDVSHSQNENLNRIVDFHNAQGAHDLDVSVHFNAYQTTSKAMGTECLYVTQEDLAGDVSAEIAAVGFLDRGAKYRSDLFFLNQTAAKSVLIEVCFVDSTADADLYRERFEDVCVAIAESVSGMELGTKPPDERPPPVSERPPVTRPPPGALGHYDNITATVFGGSADPNNSAYDEHYLNDTDLYVALPFKFKGDRPRVQVWHGEAYGVATIEDVGPWMTTDDYWAKGRRPIAEECYHHKKPLPSGPHKGKVPSNDAGLDLSPALARMIGIEGKGEVSWRFYTEQDESV